MPVASEQDLERYLEAAYQETDGDPDETVDPQRISQKTGLGDDRERQVRRKLTDKGLLVPEGSGFRLSLPAIHSVEQAWLDAGRDALVDERREQRGTYVRALYDLTDGDTAVEVALNEIQDELGMDPAVERRTRSYLDQAGLIDAQGETVRITQQGADWAAQA